MSDNRTDLSFRQAQEAREKREEVAAEAFRSCLASSETCITRAAFKLGMSETSLRKMRAGDMHIGLHDIEGMAEHEPKLFVAILERLAGLAKKRIVDEAVGATQVDRLASAARAAKECGEAVGMIVTAAATNDPADDARLIREGEEALAAIGTEVAAAKARQAHHRTAALGRHAPRGFQ